eukprot:1834837-Amphidinium_carterae.1
MQKQTPGTIPAKLATLCMSLCKVCENLAIDYDNNKSKPNVKQSILQWDFESRPEQQKWSAISWADTVRNAVGCVVSSSNRLKHTARNSQPGLLPSAPPQPSKTALATEII